MRLVHHGSVVHVPAMLVVAAVTLLACSVDPAAAARPFSPFGVNSHLIGDYRQSQIDRELDMVQRSGAQWVRVAVPWRYIEPEPDRFDPYPLSQFDNVIACAAKRGLRVQAVVLDSPDWSNGGRGPWYPPDDDTEFEEFMRFMTARYAGRVTYWELGNEVNETEFWKVPRAQSPARYTRYLQHGYRGAKEGDPDCRIISAGLAGSDYGYLQQMYDAGAKGYFDVLGVHAYTQGMSPYAVDAITPSRTFGGLALMKAVMTRNGEPDKKIWVTEVGWQTSTSGGGRVSLETQARYTYDAYRRLYRDFPYVETLFIYCLRDDGTERSEPRHNYGLLGRDYSVKPAFASYRMAADTFARRRTALSLNALRLTVARGDLVRLSGVLSPGPAGRVKLQRWNGSAWVTERNVPTSPKGAYSVSVRVVGTGVVRYRAVYSGSPVRRPAKSRTLSIRCVER